jgi:hypothetical protein
MRRKNEAARPIGLNEPQDFRIIITKPDRECCIRDSEMCRLARPVKKNEAPLAISKAAEPVAEGIAVDVRGERQDRMADGHGKLPLAGSAGGRGHEPRAAFIIA